MAVLSSLRGLVLLGLAATSALAEPRVLHMPMTRNANHPGPLAKRASSSNTAQVTVVNDVSYGLYYVNATIGTPGQELSLVLDTGSSDVWMFGTGACATSTQSQGDCFGGECMFSAFRHFFHLFFFFTLFTRLYAMTHDTCRHVRCADPHSIPLNPNTQTHTQTKL